MAKTTSRKQKLLFERACFIGIGLIGTFAIFRICDGFSFVASFENFSGSASGSFANFSSSDSVA